MLKEKFNLNTIFDTGFQIAQLEDTWSGYYLRRALRDTYVDDPFEDYSDQGYTEKMIRNRMFAQWSLDLEKPEHYIDLGNRFLDAAQPILRLFNHGKTVTDMTLNLMKAKPGYEMGWHEDISGRAPLLGFLYLIPEPLSPEDGGQLEIARVIRDDHGNVCEREIIASITPENGMLVLLENQTTRFQHRVTPLLAAKERYLMVATLGAGEF